MAAGSQPSYLRPGCLNFAHTGHICATAGRATALQHALPPTLPPTPTYAPELMSRFIRPLISLLIVIASTISASGWAEAFPGAVDSDATRVANDLGHALGGDIHQGDAAGNPACENGASGCQDRHSDGHFSPSCCAASCHFAMHWIDPMFAVLHAGRTVHVPFKSHALADHGIPALLRPPRVAGGLVG